MMLIPHIRIEGFTIVGRSVVLYQYQVNNNSTIETDGRTFVRNIPLTDITDATRISVYITINNIRIFHDWLCCLATFLYQNYYRGGQVTKPIMKN